MNTVSQLKGPVCEASGSNPPIEGRSKAIERRLNSIASSNVFQALTAELAKQDAEREAKRQAKAEEARKLRQERAAARAVELAPKREERRRQMEAKRAQREEEARQRRQARKEERQLKAQQKEQERETRRLERQTKKAAETQKVKRPPKPVQKKPAAGARTTRTTERKEPVINLPALLALSRQHEGKTLYPPRPFERRVNPGNPRWAGYRPRWLREAEKTTAIHPTDFHYYREYVHCMSQAQCAAFLRVQTATVASWEAGLAPIPYAAYIALRLVADIEYLPHQIKEWACWEIIPDGEDKGLLYNRQTGRMFSAMELNLFPYVQQAAAIAVKKSNELEQRMADLEAENERLRRLLDQDVITQELTALQGQIAALVDKARTTVVIDQFSLNTVKEPR